jgi:linoleoyl-CoA desaturase
MLVFANEAARLESFGRRIDAIKETALARVGDEDLRRVRRLRAISRACEIVGRSALMFSFEPIGFTAGVLALFVHKQLEAIEIGHTALHGAYDRFGKDTGFHSETFWWKTPIDEQSWRYGHNVRHHGNTNVAGKDPDINFGPVRLTEQTPWRPVHRVQLALALFVLFPNFGLLMNTHFTGVSDVWSRTGKPDFLPDDSLRSKVRAHWYALRKYAPYYAYEYVLFPVLAALTIGSWWKVLLGNYLSEVMRDVYSAATIFCGHVGADVASYPEGHKASSRGAWYARQVEASNDFEVSKPVSVLCGGLDLQIEHHLFPKLPPERLREVAPLVQAACEDHGVQYRKAGWGTTLKQSLGHIAALSRSGASTNEILRGAMQELT